MSEYITLVNNVKTFDNTMSDFRTKLGKIVTLDGDWYVGISEITYTKSWYNVLKDQKITLFDEIGNIYNDNSIENEDKYILKAGYYESPQKLIFEINKILNYFTNIKTPKLIYNESNNYVSVETGKVENTIKVFPELGYEIANILGLIDRKIKNTFYYVNNSISNLVFNGIENKDYIKGFHPVEISGGFHSLYLYSDVVLPSLVGDTFAPLLRVIEIPRKYKFGDTVHINYETPQYRPVRLNAFETIEISIKDDSGLSIPFKFGRVTLTLHFKNRL